MKSAPILRLGPRLELLAGCDGDGEVLCHIHFILQYFSNERIPRWDDEQSKHVVRLASTANGGHPG
jgi:hypothetical protein